MRMFKRGFSITLFYILTFYNTNDAYPTGAPNAACEDMLPQHGVDPQTSLAPYRVQISSDTITYDNSVTVNVSAVNGTFKGFLVRVVEASLTGMQYVVDGSFMPTSTESKQTCSDQNGMTHTNGDDKESVSFSWKPKSSLKIKVMFIATVVQEFSTFWTNITSDILEVNYTVPDHLSTESMHNSSLEPFSTSLPPFSSEPPPTIPQCQTGRGCFKAGCSDGVCEAVVMWNRKDDYVIFDIISNIKVGQNRWKAIGFSKTGKMADTSVIMCLFGNQVTAEMGYNDNHYTYNVVKEDTDCLTSVSGRSEDGLETCSFRRKLNSTSPDKIFSLYDKYYLLLGTGPIEGGVPTQHEDIPFVSKSRVDFLKTAEIDGDVTVPVYIKIHGSLMVLAWIFCSSLGIVVARYCKDEWPQSKPFGIKMWFHIHRTSMIAVFLVTASSFVLIFVELDGLNLQVDVPSDRQYASKHPIIGITVMSLTLINPIMAFFRVDANHPNRPIFNWMHRIVGTSAHVIAAVTVFFGLNLPKSNTPTTASYVMLGYAVTYVLIEIIFWLHSSCTTSSADNDETLAPLLASSLELSRGKRKMDKSNPFRMFVLGLHIICMTGFTSALIYFILSS